MSGTVFAQIAERVYSKQVSTNIALARDSLSVFVPEVKSGAAQPTQSLLSLMRIPHQWNGESGNQWMQSSMNSKQVVLQGATYSVNRIPDLTGMGARDAIYAIESRGMKARVRGYGKVRGQSLAAGSKVTKGRIVTIELH